MDSKGIKMEFMGLSKGIIIELYVALSDWMGFRVTMVGFE